MARLLQGILGGISGKVGNVIGSSWKGIAVVKARPLSVANPRTAGQIAQRTKMANIVAFSQLILASVIKPMWDRFSQRASGYNDFIRFNIDLFTAEMPSPASQLQISRGKMVAVNPSFDSISLTSTNVLVEYSPTLPDSLSLATDDVVAVVVNETKGVVGVNSLTRKRSQAEATVVMPVAATSGDVLNGYLAFRRADGTVVSNTGFVTATV